MSSYHYNLGLSFSAVAEQHGDRPALRYPNGRNVTYRQLLVRARQMARLMSSRGLGMGDVVCIFPNQSIDAFATVLAALSMGVIYTHLDLNLPDATLQSMMEQARPQLVLASRSDRLRACALSNHVGRRLICFEDPQIQTELMAHPADELMETPAVTGHHPAYLMFDIEAEGQPTASMITHANLLNFVAWVRERFMVSPDDVFTHLNHLAYENGVFDLFGSLFNGASLVPIGREVLHQPRELINTVNDMGCTMWYSVPSLLIYLLRLHALRPGDLRGLCTVAFGGETFPKAPLRALARHLGAGIRLMNVYSLAEATSIGAAYTVNPRDLVEDRLLPLGHFAENFQAHVLNDQGQPVPVGQVGELYLSGPNLGLGYYRDAARTEQAFFRYVNEKHIPETVFRTGDLVRQDPETGYYHFVGSRRNRVERSGHVIELELIEASLGSLEGVSECAVVYLRDAQGQGRIVAYVNAKDFDGEVLMMALRCRLPQHMLPEQIVSLSPLPKHADGKVNRQQLAEMTLS
ncbi:MAG: AMP-binding protein [Verrucomicrobiota bacterium JB022]|nr:AMP-binding protein [Verrucomicrobiota bacterium JB022]